MPVPSTDTHCQCCGLSDAFNSWSDSIITEPLWNTSLTFTPNEVSAGNAHVANLRDVVQGLESAIKTLRKKKVNAEARLAQQISHLAPVQRIPDEILMLIMEIACGVKDFYPGHHFHEEKQGTNFERRVPWTIAAVCRRWRALSLAIPQLWTRIEHGLVEQEIFMSTHVALQVKRSREEPLIVKVDMESEDMFHNCMTGALEPHVHRIQELDMLFNWLNGTLTRPLNLASLQRLRLSNTCFNKDQAAFHDAPFLKHLFLRNVEVGPNTLTLIAPNSWTTVKSLQLDNFQPSEPHLRHLIQLLQLTRNLSLLKLVPESTYAVSLESQLDVVSLPHLKSFHMCFANDKRVSQRVLPLIQAPSLTYFQVSCVCPSDLPAILAFVELASSASEGGLRSSQITTLSVRAPYGPQNAFGVHMTALLGKLHFLRCLQLHQGKVHHYDYIKLDSFLLSLASLRANPEIQWSPHLEELHLAFDGSTSSRLSLHSLQAFCNSRTSQGTVFGTVFVSRGSLPALDGAHEDDDEDALRQWGTEAQQSGLLKYPAPEGSWVDIF